MQTHCTEIWKDIVGYEGFYQVSNLGRVKSVARIVIKINWQGTRSENPIPEKIRKLTSEGKYKHLYLPLWKDDKGKNFKIHRLVLQAFIGPCPKGMEGCHNDGDPENNKLDNLRWDTHKNNHQDRLRHGTSNRGAKNGSTKLTEEIVIEMRKMYATGNYLMKEVAEAFGVHKNSIRPIIKGETWKYVEFLPESNFGRGIDRLNRLAKKKAEKC